MDALLVLNFLPGHDPNTLTQITFPPIAARRGRENEDEIWKQLEQLRLDQLRLGLDVQRVATQSRYREEGQGTVVGKGRSRHTRTSPNQNSLIYKIAQEKAQEMAANQSNSKNGLVFYLN